MDNPKCQKDGGGYTDYTGMCCCNCRFHLSDHSHPTTDGGRVTQQRGWVCAGFLFTEPENIVFSGWSEHGLCEMWALNRASEDGT